MKRVYESLLNDHHKQNRQMAFVAGPRQVGKTTSCKKSFRKYAYLNWDNKDDRMLFTNGPGSVADKIGVSEIKQVKSNVIFDELHKFSAWKIFLKGFFDTYSDRVKITVTGSSRLNIYKRGGDSLMGRYFLYRMHPLSVAELIHTDFSETEIKKPKKINNSLFDTLLKFGGFPEPLIKSNMRFFIRWKKLREEQLFNEDVRDFTHINEIGQLQVLAELLKRQPGQLVNYSNLANKVTVSVNTIKLWISSLNSLYYCFVIRPWFKNISKSLKKQPKIYLWDWSNIEDSGAKNENFVASHLLKAVHWWTDIGLGNYNLYYVRDKQKREVDFLVTRNNTPWFLVEVKTSQNRNISPNLVYFQKQTKALHAFQVVFDRNFIEADSFNEKNPIIIPASTFLSQLV